MWGQKRFHWRGAVLRLVGYLAASLGSSHSMQPPSCGGQKSLQTLSKVPPTPRWGGGGGGGGDGGKGVGTIFPSYEPLTYLLKD